MKKFLVLVMLVMFGFNLAGCSNKDAENVIRIHIRANSNSVHDQEVKLCVRDEIINYITPLISICKNSSEVKDILNSNLNEIEDVVDEVLYLKGYHYKSNAEIRNEYFPSRDYDGVTFPSDYYDALIIELGTGKGDNWWCVAYPPLCFVGEDTGSNNVKYKSKIIELINKYFGE